VLNTASALRAFEIRRSSSRHGCVGAPRSLKRSSGSTVGSFDAGGTSVAVALSARRACAMSITVAVVRHDTGSPGAFCVPCTPSESVLVDVGQNDAPAGPPLRRRAPRRSRGLTTCRLMATSYSTSGTGMLPSST